MLMLVLVEVLTLVRSLVDFPRRSLASLIMAKEVEGVDGHFGCYLFCLNLHEKGK